MKRFWIVILALGLIAAFSTTAFALDVKFSGEFYTAGLYLDKTSLNKYGFNTTAKPPVYVNPGISTAFYYQRLRLKTDFVISPGLVLVTRGDFMERAWGANRSASATYSSKTGLSAAQPAVDSAATVAENENAAIDWAYVEYKSPIGIFSVGYMNYGSTGTIFGNTALLREGLNILTHSGRCPLIPPFPK